MSSDQFRTDAESGVEEHRASGPTAVRVGVLTVSDTRDAHGDLSGAMIRSLLESNGHVVLAQAIVKDERGAIASIVVDWTIDDWLDALIVTGGTGVASRDTTPEAVEPLFERVLPGFGELFRMLSFEEVGSAAMLSRAQAGVVRKKPVLLLPGSRNAVKLAMERLILPELRHLVFESGK
ncbi:molybdenum cofactor biosynthesis protein MoaB [soil metagenome]